MKNKCATNRYEASLESLGLSLNDIINLIHLAKNNIYQGQPEQSIFTPKIPTRKLTHLSGHIPEEINELIKYVNTSRDVHGSVNSRKILFYGEPGTGKSWLAEAISGELEWNFYHVFASSLITKWQGSGSKQIKSLFNSVAQLLQCEENQPMQKGAVIFIDEIDGIANAKAKSQSEINRTIIALHEAVDALPKNVICIIATNHVDNIPATIISRFKTNLIGVEVPSQNKRLKILQNLLQFYQIDESYLQELSVITQNWSCRDIDNLLQRAKTINPQLFLASYQPNQQEITKIKNTLQLAYYFIQDHTTPGHNEIKSVLHYCLQAQLPQATAHEIDNLINNELKRTLTHLHQLSGREIMSSIRHAVSFKPHHQRLINAQDLLVGIYYDNQKKIPKTVQRKLIIDYFFKQQGITYNNGNLDILAQELDDNLTGKDLQTFCMKARQLAGSARQENVLQYIQDNTITHAELFCAIQEILGDTAKPFKIIESFSLQSQYQPVGSFNIGIGNPPKNDNNKASFTLGAGINVNLPWNYTTKYPNFTIEYVQLKDKTKFHNDSSRSIDNTKKIRLEMRNKNTPSPYMIYYLFKYFLIRNSMSVNQSLMNIFNAEILKILFNSDINSTTVKEIIEYAIDIAQHSNRATCTKADILAALENSNFNLKGYIHIKETMVPQAYRYIYANILTNILKNKQFFTMDENIAAIAQTTESNSSTNCSVM